MTNNTVWIVECQCPDPFFSPNFVGVFSTEDKAKAYISKMPSYSQHEYEVTEHTIDELMNVVFDNK